MTKTSPNDVVWAGGEFFFLFLDKLTFIHHNGEPPRHHNRRLTTTITSMNGQPDDKRTACMGQGGIGEE